MVCSRCLDTFIYPIDIDIEERFTKSKELQDDEELIFVEDDTLDIIQIVENCIISTLPIKRLCKEDCKGLCSQCGTNKNVKECQCDAIEYDYPTFHLSMDCFWAKVSVGELELKEAEAAKWLTKDELDSVAWLPADITLIGKIKECMSI